MLLLMSSAHPTHMKYRHPLLGRLVVPRDWYRVDETHAAGIPWAADNGAYTGLDEAAWLRMINGISGVPGCLFATVPDSVGSADETSELWSKWAPTVIGAGLPAAWVAQDGADDADIPDDASAVFIGGTTEFKFSHEAQRIVRTAKARGLWAHVGRVNTIRRIRYCQSLDVDSFDGTKWNRFKDAYLPQVFGLISGGRQLGLAVDK